MDRLAYQIGPGRPGPRSPINESRLAFRSLTGSLKSFLGTGEPGNDLSTTRASKRL
jgi:hypothetical protein